MERKINKSLISVAKPYIDPYLFFVVITIIAYGLLMLFSSSIEISSKKFNNPFYYFNKQLIFLAISVIIFFILEKIKLDSYKKISVLFLFFSIILIFLVIFPNIGIYANGSRRWLSLYFFTFQPSEIFKLSFLIWLCAYLANKKEDIKDIKNFIIPIIVLCFSSLLILMEPDFGSTILLSIITFLILFIAGAQIFHMLFFATVATPILIILIYYSGHAKARIISFLNPWDDPLDKGYHLTQSLMGIGSGGILGKGLGASTSKLFFLPETHTDFIFAVIAEELGLFGVIAIVLLFSSLIWKSFQIGENAIRVGMKFEGYLAYGIGFFIGGQALIHMAVNLGLVPTKGLALPFFSAGGTNYIISMFSLFLLFKIYREVYVKNLKKMGIRN
ncbi:MAG: putative lipid II flippase FtsW [Pseudomonadota bacterium]|nr:putative lipid II flippase FtsW [Pseudomonadota bacterium]|tara:strand:+ start:412 stop:1575 length:1164 start_codon:yes stop_codon:yes gene_type:complete